jgi:hypothetical protein
MDNKLLRQFVREVVVSASPEYMQKESIREHLQTHLVELVKSGQIQSDEELAAYFKTLEMAAMALKNVPLAVWRQMSQG